MPRLSGGVDARRAAHRVAAPVERRDERPSGAVRSPQGAEAAVQPGSIAMELRAAMEELDPVADPRYHGFLAVAALRAGAEYEEQAEIPVVPAAVVAVSAGLAE